MSTDSHYTAGTMNIDDQTKTYAGFLSASVLGAGLIILICLFAILTTAAKFAWLPSLAGTVVFGLLYGLLLKLKTGWYATVIALAILGALISLLIVFVA